MRLYHYLESKWALDNIRRRRLKLSKIDDMNDPYEWACVRAADDASQATLERARRDIAELHGVLCFSRSWNKILMWSHYGGRHGGICLGFDVPDGEGRFMEIKYLNELVVAPNLSGLPREQQKPFFELLYTGKYGGWRYEEEIRTFARRDKKDDETGLRFASFDEDLKLREVIAGANFQLSKAVIEEALSGYPAVISKVGISAHRFEVILDEDGFKRS